MKCRKLKNGAWECYAEGPRDPITNKRNAIRKQAKKKSDAQRKVTQALEVLKEGVDSRGANTITFAELAAEWLEEYKTTGIKNSTLSNRVSSINTINRYIGDVLVGRATHQTIQDVLTDMFRRGKSKSSLDQAKVAMNFVFTLAILRKLRVDNPVTHVRIPKKRQTVEEIEGEDITENFFEREELERFLRAADERGLQHDREWFLLLAFTGMRAGEMCALKWGDINFAEKTIRITKTMENIKAYKSYELTPPKTTESIRTIDVDDDIIAMLKRVAIRQIEYRLKYKLQTADYHEEDFVFTRPKDGYPYAPRFIYRRSLRLCKIAGLSKVAGPHILRHTHVTMLTEAGTELHIIMERVGHVNAATTRNIYTHVSNRKKKETAHQLGNHYGDIFKAYSGG